LNDSEANSLLNVRGEEFTPPACGIKISGNDLTAGLLLINISVVAAIGLQ
jgi:hypothetical protein